MRFGFCGKPTDAELARAAGFDYVEVWAATCFGDPAAPRIHAEVCNGFFPSDQRLFIDPTAWQAYAHLAVQSAVQAGVSLMVIGSGNQRRSTNPHGDAAFLDAVATIQEFARPLGVTIAPESLNREETNVGTDLGALARALAARDLAYTADSYHVLKEWAYDGIVPTADAWAIAMPLRPAHVHIADVSRTGVPTDDAGLRAFAQRLRDLGYDGRVTYEGKRGDDLAALQSLRQNLANLFAG